LGSRLISFISGSKTENVTGGWIIHMANVSEEHTASFFRVGLMGCDILRPGRSKVLLVPAVALSPWFSVSLSILVSFPTVGLLFCDQD
jgi:hypothetical protein